MHAVLLALVAFAGWGTGDIFGTVASRRVGSLSATLLINLAGVLVFAAYIPFALVHLPLWVIVLSGSLGIELTLAYLSFNEALRIGNPSVVGTIAGSFAALVVPLSVVFLHQHVTLIQLAAIGMVILGVGVTSLDLETVRESGVGIDRSIGLSLVALVGWGIYFTFIKVPIDSVGWFWPGYIAAITGLLILAVLSGRRISRSSMRLRPAIWPATLTAVLISGAAFCFNAALQTGNPAIVTPIAGSYPVLFVLLSSLAFRQPVTGQQKLGMGITLVSIVVLSLLAQ